MKPSLLLLFLFLIGSHFQVHAQKVGVVLSGGGADALAHVGVLKALEENNIPIDYITGTSVGALVGSLYAAGYSPAEIEALVSSQDFVNFSKGIDDGRHRYLFSSPYKEASIFGIDVSGDSTLNTSLPTNMINSTQLDFNLLKILGPASRTAHFNFDSLFVPFRCVATDIFKNEAVVFSSGNLHTAVRASLTYPFYIHPIEVNGVLLFDGGLLNNLPVDLMQQNFAPDIIIASNVGEPAIPPKADDLYSQLKNLIQLKSDYSLQGNEGILIEPNPNVGLFGFEKATDAIQNGYRTLIDSLGSIQALIQDQTQVNEVKGKRADYRANSQPLIFSSVETEKLSQQQSKFVKKRLEPSKSVDCSISVDEIESKYYQLTDSKGFSNVFPTIGLNGDSNLSFIYSGERKRNLEVEFGGNVSSRPVSTGFVGVTYSSLRKTLQEYHLNTYFGKLYTGARIEAVYELSSKRPIAIQPHFTLHQWDYFESRFEDFLVAERPSYLIQREQYGGVDIRMAQKLSGVFHLKAEGFQTVDDYYQSNSFTAGDTADRTRLEGANLSFEWQSSTLNKKQYATKGTEYTFRIRKVWSQESYFPGSTSNDVEDVEGNTKQWIQTYLRYQKYFIRESFVKFGLNFEGFYSTQGAFQNNSATIARAFAYSPIPESKTLFLESFRANKFLSSGLQLLFDASPRFNIRLEGYIFQPIEEIIATPTNEVTFGEPFEKRYFLNSGSVVYHSPLGPVSLSVNYYYNQPEISPERNEPISVFFNFGYIINNPKALD